MRKFEELDMIAEDKKKELELIVKFFEEKNNCMGVQKVILFGSYSRGDGVDDSYLDKNGTLREYKSDFDILIVMKSEEKVRVRATRNRIKRELGEVEGIETPLSIIFHGIEYLNDQIKNRSYFFLDIYNDGVILFDNNRHEISEPLEELPKEVRLSKATFYYEKWLKSADSFLVGFENYYRLKEYKMAVFNLHQTAEHLYMGALLVHTDYKPKSHDLLKLDHMVRAEDERYEEAFPCKTEEEKRLFKKLKDSYIDSRYNDDFVIHEGELVYMSGRVRTLQKLVEKLCNEFIMNFSDGVEVSIELKAKLEKISESIDDFYETRKEAMREHDRLIAKGYSQGKNDGISEGKELGRKEEKLDIARRLLKTKVSVRNIAVITGLTEEEVLSIK